LGLCKGSVEIRIDVEAHRAWFPLDGVEMKSVGEFLSGGKAEGRSGIARRAGSTRAVKRTVDGAGLLADIFHDVDFAALRPADGSDVVAEHPERGPHSLPLGNLDAGFKPAIGLAEEAYRFEASGSVVAGCAATAGVAGLVLCGNDQVASQHLGVFREAGITFEFVVAPAVAAGVVCPLGRIERSSIGSVEFVVQN